MASSAAVVLNSLGTEARQLILGTPLAEDKERLRQLATLSGAEQGQVLRLHLNLKMPWDEAIGSFLPSTPRTRIAGEIGDIVLVDVALLRPNSVNGAVFSASLTEVGIEALAEDFGRRKQRVPIEITLEGEIIEGERRWRAAQKRGDKQLWAKIVAERMTESEVRAYIFDAHATGRDASVLERIRFYGLALAVLKERHGLPPGRPKLSSNEDGLTGHEIRERAAKRAGLGSAEKARRAVKVLESSDDEIRTAMLTETISINGAYARLGGTKDPEPEGDDFDRFTDGGAASATSALNVRASTGESPTEGAGGDDALEEQSIGPAPQQLLPDEPAHAVSSPASPASNERPNHTLALSPDDSTNASRLAAVRNAQPVRSDPASALTPSPIAVKKGGSISDPKSAAPDVERNEAGERAGGERKQSRRAPAAKERSQRNDDRAARSLFERCLESMVAYIVALNERDTRQAREARNEAKARLDAAVGGPIAVETSADEESESDDEVLAEDADPLEDEDDDDDDQGDEEDLNEVEQDDDQEYSTESAYEEDDFEEEDDDSEPLDPQEAEIERLVPTKRARRP